MIEIKTLKDITIRQGEPEYWNYIHKDELRAEVIKLIRLLDSDELYDFEEHDILGYKYEYDGEAMPDAREIIMRFFNLSEEDLK